MDARLVIDEDGGAVHTRTLIQVQNSESVSIQQEFRPELNAYDDNTHVNMDYGGGWRELALLERKSTATNPVGTALCVNHWFRGNAGCAGRRLMLRYVDDGMPD